MVYDGFQWLEKMQTKQTWKIGDALTLTKELEDNSIDTIVTSPPYWGLRDYGVETQIGLEQTLDEYHARLLQVTAELKRVLKKSSTMFWVHGDSYGGSWQNYGSRKGGQREKNTDSFDRKGNPTSSYPPSARAPPKCLTMQNYRLAERMIDEQGWVLRNILIWHKKNHMPSSVKDRFANAYEPIFFFSKSKKYWFDLDAIREPHQESSRKRVSQNNGNPNWNGNNKRGHPSGKDTLDPTQFLHPQGKNPGDVFTLSAQPFPEAHFAVFPEKLIEPFIKAGCPIDGIVLDPFCGSGTVLKVCRLLNRNAIGFELNPEYEPFIRERSMSHVPPLASYPDEG